MHQPNSICKQQNSTRKQQNSIRKQQSTMQHPIIHDLIQQKATPPYYKSKFKNKCHNEQQKDDHPQVPGSLSLLGTTSKFTGAGGGGSRKK